MALKINPFWQEKLLQFTTAILFKEDVANDDF